MRAMRPTTHWNERLLRIGFWSMNTVLVVFGVGRRASAGKRDVPTTVDAPTLAE